MRREANTFGEGDCSCNDMHFNFHSCGCKFFPSRVAPHHMGNKCLSLQLLHFSRDFHQQLLQFSTNFHQNLGLYNHQLKGIIPKFGSSVRVTFFCKSGLILWQQPFLQLFSHPLDKNIPFYRCLRFFYPSLLSQLGSESCLSLSVIV